MRYNTINLNGVDTRRYLIIAYANDSTHLYQMLANTSDKEQVKTRYLAIAQEEGWEGILRVDVVSMNKEQEELSSLAILGPEQ